jgi:serine/threonine-protein kinase
LQLGRYQILKQLATGSVADVLLARASGLEGFARHVVIKRIRPEMATEERFVKAFLDEARIAGSLHHQNIVTVHDIGEQDGSYFFAMEYVHGEDARRLIGKVRERGEHVPLEHALSIVMAAAAGLHHAHEQSTPGGERLGLVHRDVSPQNILIGYDGSVKIVDFGMAKAVAKSTTTMTGILKGKASYMSPEQCTGKPLDRRTDVFCLGIVLYELITAQRLFKGANEFMTMAAIVEGVIPKPSTLRTEVPPALDEIILRALQRSPESRYQTAEALRESLEAFALAQELRTSGKALADYLTGLFGQRPEPWEARAATDPPPPEVDYEHTHAKGLVPTPGVNRDEMIARLALRAESPMMQAEAADAEWDDEDEGVKTAGDRPSLGVLGRSAPRAGSESHLRTTPTPTVGAEARRPIDRRATSAGDDSGRMTVTETAEIDAGKSGADDVTRTQTQETPTSDTATDLPVSLDDATMSLRPRIAPPPSAGGDETENRTLIEPSTFDSSADPTATDAEGDDDFEQEAATEIANDADPLWKHHNDPKAPPAAGPGKGRVSPAVIPRANLPASKAPRPARPSAPPPPLPQRPTPMPPAPPSLAAPGPGGPLTLPGHAPPAPPSPLGGAPAFSPLQPTYPSPPPGPLPPVPFVAPPSAFGAPPPGPAPSFELRGSIKLFVEKHATRLWIASGVALVLLVILSARGCGDAPARTNTSPAADTPAEK